VILIRCRCTYIWNAHAHVSFIRGMHKRHKCRKGYVQKSLIFQVLWRFECVCVSVCMCEREREYVCAYVRVCVCVCVCVGGWVGAAILPAPSFFILFDISFPFSEGIKTDQTRAWLRPKVWHPTRTHLLESDNSHLQCLRF
jgi:hypothetical protein